MGKNWLIRTKSNHILGPVSKEKVLELYQNGSIKADDEICSGNGYWFFIRESELVDKYLKGHISQGFNPISEAKDVLTSSSGHSEDGPTRDDITIVGGIDLNKMKEVPEAPAPVRPAPRIEVPEIPVKNDSIGSPKKKLKSESQTKYSDIPKKPVKQNYLRYLGVLVFLILLGIIYFRKSILRSFFQSEAYLQSSSLIMASAVAQDSESIKKKSS